MRRKNIVILTHNTKPRKKSIDFDLTEFNEMPEQLLRLAKMAQIEYGVGLAVCEYKMNKSFEGVEPYDQEELDEIITEIAMKVAKEIGWE